MSAVRGLCKRFQAPAAPPHIYAGISSILTLPAPMDDGVEDGHVERLRKLGVEALTVAVYILVRTRLSGVETNSNDYSAQRDEALTVLNELRSVKEPSSVLDPQNVDGWLREVQRGHWLEMDWFENIGQGAGLGLESKARGTDEDASDDSDMDGAENFLINKHKYGDDRGSKSYLQPGLGTMVSSLPIHVDVD